MLCNVLLSNVTISLSVYLSICKLGNLAILRDFFVFQSWQHQKRSNSARLPQCLNLTTSKTQQFCETSSFFKVDNIKNEAILQDFLNVWTWQRQKRSNSARLPHFSKLTTSKRKNSARLPSKMEIECRADGLVPIRFAIFPVHLSKVLRLPRKSDARSYDVLHLSCKIISANLKIWGSKM